MSATSSERRAILQVRWGPMALRKSILEPGQILRVGRDEAADLALPHDSQLAGAHFELTWDGDKCRVRDLRTTTGTYLNGQPLKEGPVSHGSWIRAGGTDFVVYVEHQAPPGALENKAPLAQVGGFKRHAWSVLSTHEGLYAVLDAARDERILTLLQESIDEYHSLYEGPRGAALENVAPYLVQFQRGSRLPGTLVQEGWGNHWGTYFTSSSPFAEVRRHLRKFLIIELEGDPGRFYFRFYDPRVLHDFLPTCTAEQRKDFFGPIGHFLYESTEEPGIMTATA